MSGNLPLSPMGKRILLRRSFTLALVLVLTVAGLFLLQKLTADRVAQWEWEENRAQMAQVMPSATAFTELIYTSADREVDDIQAAYTGQTLVGYCVTVTEFGFQGEITLLVGVDTSGVVTGVNILSCDEHPEIGALVEDPAFLDQFTGQTGTLTMGSGRNSIVAAPGAAASSQGVMRGVNQALAAVANLNPEEVGTIEEVY